MKSTTFQDNSNARARQLERIKSMQDVKKTYSKLYCENHLTARPERNEDGTLPAQCASGKRLDELCVIKEGDNE